MPNFASTVHCTYCVIVYCVLSKEEDGWAKGRVRDKEGVFPTNFCEPHTEKEAPAAAANTSEQTNGDVTNQILPKKVGLS